uniref:Uncharacterized protein n=1 Tax=Helicotheca tamesis TaxID=374047 RepID=A0A7S2E223_9STRA|mmetsp:Transcript_11282/g.15623  ORF Transcript_11282/g.15623 Transcript_11282/m.15623 type:complete len:197 (+) Transcript_11282:1-591(+)
MTFQADVSNEEEVISLYDSIYTKFGRYPTGLVNNAGILGTRNADITSMTTADLEQVFAVNVYGPFYCTREFVRRWKIMNGNRQQQQQRGSIVNVSSGSAHIGNPLFYAMSKGALNSFMAGLSKTLPADHNIRMNAIAPGVTKTDIVTDEMADKVMPLIPMKRVGEPEEIAEGIVFLISDGSSYCSGANVRMAGGRP